MKRKIIRRFLIVDTVETWTIAVVNGPAETPGRVETRPTTALHSLAAEGDPHEDKTLDDA